MMEQRPRRLNRAVGRLTLLTVAAALVVGLLGLGFASAGWSLAASAQEAPGETVAAQATAEVDEQAVAEVGSRMMITSESLNYRATPGLAGAVIAVLPQGQQGTITGGPVSADGYTWYEFTTTGYGPGGEAPGWLAGEFLGPVSTSAFPAGTMVAVTGDELLLRATPGADGEVIAPLALGIEVTLVSGPVAADGHDWYEVQVPALVGTGWVVGTYLDIPQETGTFVAGERVAVTADALNLRDAPASDATVLAVLPTGSAAWVVGSPTVSEGRSWYQITLDGVNSAGWVAGEFLAYSH